MCDLLPVDIVLSTYFAKKCDEIGMLSSELENLMTQLSEMEEENPDETGDTVKEIKAKLAASQCPKPMIDEESILTEFLPILAIKGKEGKDQQAAYISALSDYFKNFEKINKTAITKRIKEVQTYEPLDSEVATIMRAYVDLSDDIARIKAQIKDKSAALYTAVISKYASLDETNIKDLVVRQKWQASITAQAEAELKNAIQAITGDIQTLVERYAVSLPETENKVSMLREKVNAHLVAMGITV